jgi:hypothetical protein
MGAQSACTNNLPFILSNFQIGVTAIGAGAASANLESGATGSISIGGTTALGKLSHSMTSSNAGVMNVGGGNVAVGYGSMLLNAGGTGQVDVGTDNIFIGAFAGQVDAVNVQAGYGSTNIFIGQYAGYRTASVLGNTNIDRKSVV